MGRTFADSLEFEHYKHEVKRRSIYLLRRTLGLGKPPQCELTTTSGPSSFLPKEVFDGLRASILALHYLNNDSDHELFCLDSNDADSFSTMQPHAMNNLLAAYTAPGGYNTGIVAAVDIMCHSQTSHVNRSISYFLDKLDGEPLLDTLVAAVILSATTYSLGCEHSSEHELEITLRLHYLLVMATNGVRACVARDERLHLEKHLMHAEVVAPNEAPPSDRLACSTTRPK